MVNAKWCILSIVALVLGFGPTRPQDPQPARPPAPPADAQALSPVEEPYVESVSRRDLPERFTPRDPIEGVWRLRSRVVGGIGAESGSGFMIVGRRHLMAQFQAPGPDPEFDLLRSGTYEWLRSGEQGGVRTTVLLGHYNDDSGDVHVEAPGSVEVRRFELLDGFLRLHQEGGDWLEFARIE